MNGKVILALERKKAELLARLTAGALIGSPTRTLNGPIHAALDRDPDELVEQVARGICGAALSKGTVEKVFREHERMADAFRRQGEAAIAALTGKGKA